VCSVSFRCLLQDVSCYSCIDDIVLAAFSIRSYAEVIWKKTGSLTTGRLLHGRRQFPPQKLFASEAHALGHLIKIQPAHLPGVEEFAHGLIGGLKLIAEMRMSYLRMLQISGHGLHGLRRADASGHAFPRHLLARLGATASERTNGGRQRFDVNHQTRTLNSQNLRKRPHRPRRHSTWTRWKSIRNQDNRCRRLLHP